MGEAANITLQDVNSSVGLRLHTALQQNPKASTTVGISARPQHILERGLGLVMPVGDGHTQLRDDAGFFSG